MFALVRPPMLRPPMATHKTFIWFHNKNIISPRKFIIQQIQTGFSYNRYSFFSLAIWNPLLSPTTCVCLRTLMIGNPGTDKSLNIAFSWFNINTSPTCQFLFYKVLCWKQHQSFFSRQYFSTSSISRFFVPSLTVANGGPLPVSHVIPIF